MKESKWQRRNHIISGSEGARLWLSMREIFTLASAFFSLAESDRLCDEEVGQLRNVWSLTEKYITGDR